MRQLIILASGDTDGRIVPCGCTTNQSGGLPRRGTYVKQLRRQADVIVVDVGRAPHGTSPYDRVKFEAILQGEIAMDVSAHNIGAAEAALGADYLREMQQRLDVPLISCNVRDSGGKLIAPFAKIIESGARSVAILGVLDPQLAPSGFVVDAPRQAVLDAIGDLAEPCDTIVVLAYMEEDALLSLAESLPEVDLVIGGPTGQPVQPQRVGPTLVASSTKEGKFLARFDAPSRQSKDPWKGRIVELDERFADEPAQMANLKHYYAELTRRDFTPQETSFVEPAQAGLPDDYRIAGRERCRECHAQQCEVYDGSRHAHAWDSLTAKGSHVDPDCQRCHTTGYGLPGGFVSPKRTPAAVNAGCESCHGPSQAHVEDPEVYTPHYRAAADHCRGCHDRENSPDFDYEQYWDKIRHGSEPDAPAEDAVTHEDVQ